MAAAGLPRRREQRRLSRRRRENFEGDARGSGCCNKEGSSEVWMREMGRGGGRAGEGLGQRGGRRREEEYRRRGRLEEAE